MFKNRIEAGKLLAQALEEFKGKNPIVLAIPRGGVVVGREVSRVLSAPLDILVVRKLGAPGNPELAIGATNSTGNPILDNKLIQNLEITKNYVNSEISRQKEEARRREEIFREKKKPLSLAGKTVILVDDGLATGATMKASAKLLKSKKPKQIIIAVPVAPQSTLDKLSNADKVICLYTPENFYAIGQFYEDFKQVSDEEVIDILRNFGG